MAILTARIDETSPARIAERALANLGDTDDTVAAALAASGFVTEPGVGAGDVIARYLLAADPQLVSVTVEEFEARLDRPDETTDVDLPGPVLGFAYRFDMGRYPHLINRFSLPNPLVNPGTTSGSEHNWMKTLTPEQWRVLGRLIYLCGKRARLLDMLKTQDVAPETVCELVERGLIVAKLNSEEIDLTPGLIKTHRRRLFLNLSKAGESYYWDDPHRVLRSIGNARIGLSLSYLLGMVFIEDLADLHRKGLIEALTEDGDLIDLGNARQPWPGSLRLLLGHGAEAWVSAVRIRVTRAGRLYGERN